jgi:hypothetical protein
VVLPASSKPKLKSDVLVLLHGFEISVALAAVGPIKVKVRSPTYRCVPLKPITLTSVMVPPKPKVIVELILPRSGMALGKPVATRVVHFIAAVVKA